jgi:hypothetical protein
LTNRAGAALEGLRSHVYGLAVSEAGFFDYLTHGGFTGVADHLGAHVDRCSYDYLAGRYGPDVAAGRALTIGRGPDFVVDPNGNVVPIPSGQVVQIQPTMGRDFGIEVVPVVRGKAPLWRLQFSDRTSNVRIMDPTSKNPGGYVNYSIPNPHGKPQSINPYTGQTIDPSDPMWHQPIDLNPPMEIVP